MLASSVIDVMERDRGKRQELREVGWLGILSQHPVSFPYQAFLSNACCDLRLQILDFPVIISKQKNKLD